MENKQIKDLMIVMERTGTKRLSIKNKDFELQLERDDSKQTKDHSSNLEDVEDSPLKHEMALHRATAVLSRGNVEVPQPLSGGAPVQEIGKFVTSPMVGTFYTAASTDADSYVKVGDQVTKETVVCIIEAMKVMNEIKAGVSGTVAEVLVENSHPVEFGTKLFRIT